jgi:hypothetical protein
MRRLHPRTLVPDISLDIHEDHTILKAWKEGSNLTQAVPQSETSWLADRNLDVKWGERWDASKYLQSAANLEERA